MDIYLHSINYHEGRSLDEVFDFYALDCFGLLNCASICAGGLVYAWRTMISFWRFMVTEGMLPSFPPDMGNNSRTESQSRSSTICLCRW